MTHDEVQTAVLDWCDAHGLLSHCCDKARRCRGRGLPDVLIVGRRGWLIAEIKRDGEEPRGEQISWKYALLALGLPYRVWHTSDWPGCIVAELEAIA